MTTISDHMTIAIAVWVCDHMTAISDHMTIAMWVCDYMTVYYRLVISIVMS